MTKKYLMSVSAYAFINDKMEVENDIYGKEFNDLFEVFDAILAFENTAEEWLKWVMNDDEISRPTETWSFRIYDTTELATKAVYLFNRETKELTRI